MTMKRDTATWLAFLLVCFAVVGLMGVFASYAAPLPLERAVARETALDEALATGGDRTALEAMRGRLDDSAALVIDGAGPLGQRVAAAREAMRASLLHEAAVVADRLRLELVVVTLVAAGFGALMLAAAARSR